MLSNFQKNNLKTIKINIKKTKLYCIYINSFGVVHNSINVHDNCSENKNRTVSEVLITHTIFDM